MSSVVQSVHEPTPDKAAIVAAKKTAAFPFLDLKTQFLDIEDEVMAAVVEVMRSQHFIMGPNVKALEDELGIYLQAKHAVGCASGSDALLLALMALGVGPGDEVITTPFTFVATAGAIARCGATPVFVDIDERTFNIRPDLVRAAVTERTKTIIPVHLFGLCSDMDEINTIAAEHHLAVIEDAAQAIGSEYQGKRAGSLGTFGCFSFFPSKNLGGAGDGGLVTTNDDGLANKLRLIRVHGSPGRYQYDLLGTNSRLDALQAAILRVKFKHLPAWTRARQERAAYYRDLFAEHHLSSRIQVPSAPQGYTHVYNQFVVRCPGVRDSLQAFLTERGVPTEIYYPYPLHLQPAFHYLGYGAGRFPISEACSKDVLALPIGPELTREQQLSVVRAIAEFYSH